MSYLVKECFVTLQGEGAHVGRVSVLCRMTGCNLWSGREEDRQSAVCRFCDTKFVGTDGDGGGSFADAIALAKHAKGTWDASAKGRASLRVLHGWRAFAASR